MSEVPPAPADEPAAELKPHEVAAAKAEAARASLTGNSFLQHQAAHGADPPEGFTERFLKAKKAAHAANEERLGHPPPIACVARIARAAVAAGVPASLVAVPADVVKRRLMLGLEPSAASAVRALLAARAH